MWQDRATSFRILFASQSIVPAQPFASFSFRLTLLHQSIDVARSCHIISHPFGHSLWYLFVGVTVLFLCRRGRLEVTEEERQWQRGLSCLMGDTDTDLKKKRYPWERSEKNERCFRTFGPSGPNAKCQIQNDFFTAWQTVVSVWCLISISKLVKTCSCRRSSQRFCRERIRNSLCTISRDNEGRGARYDAVE